MLEAFQYPFMQRALIAALMVGFTASFYAPFIVQRRMAFMGAGLSHAAFGGVALGIFLGVSPLWAALPFTLCVALGMVWVREQSRLAEDTTIGIFFAVSMAIGIILLAKSPSYSTDAFTYLFGSILAVRQSDLLLGGAGVVMALLSFGMWPRWAYATFERGLARTDGIPVQRDDYVLAACLAVTVVIAIKLVGIILAAAFLVLPAAAARLISHSMFSMTLISILWGVFSAVSGLFLAYYLDIPSGPAIILLQTVGFIFALGISRFRAN